MAAKKTNGKLSRKEKSEQLTNQLVTILSKSSPEFVLFCLADACHKKSEKTRSENTKKMWDEIDIQIANLAFNVRRMQD